MQMDDQKKRSGRRVFSLTTDVVVLVVAVVVLVRAPTPLGEWWEQRRERNEIAESISENWSALIGEGGRLGPPQGREVIIRVWGLRVPLLQDRPPRAGAARGRTARANDRVPPLSPFGDPCTSSDQLGCTVASRMHRI